MSPQKYSTQNVSVSTTLTHIGKQMLFLIGEYVTVLCMRIGIRNILCVITYTY